MAFKQFELAGVGAVTVYKRRGARSIRLSVDRRGKVRITLPAWAAYQAGLQYALSKQAWLRQQLLKRTPEPLAQNQIIGKQHRLLFAASGDDIRTRLKGNDIIVRHPSNLSRAASSVQQAAERACVRALRQEAEEFLPPRLQQLAAQHGFDYRSIEIKRLSGRWGSCDHRRHIIINLFIMQLPWELIDYVLLHELTHTEQLNHGADFWQRFGSVLPEARARRKILRDYQPQLGFPAGQRIVA